MGETPEPLEQQQIDDQEYGTDDVSHEDWMLFVAQALHAELADERQDIYTEADGEPIPWPPEFEPKTSRMA